MCSNQHRANVIGIHWANVFPVYSGLVGVRVRVMVMVRVKVRFRVRVSCFLSSTPHLYAIQSQLRPRMISGDWFQEPSQNYG